MRLALALALGCEASATSCSRPNAASAPTPNTTSDRAHGFAQADSLPFISDNYAEALSQARQRKLPLFVDVWAGWCHTCLSLQQYVFPDPALVKLKDAFVWLSIDSELASNAPFLRQFPMRSWPTLWLIDPTTEQPLLKWAGAATAQELALILEQAVGTQTASNATQATALWLRGDRASATGDAAAAITHYRDALTQAPQAWPLRSRVVEALSTRYAETHDKLHQVELASQEAAHLPPGTARLNVVLNAIDAADALSQSSAPQPDPASYDALLKLGTRIAQDPGEPVLLDDRSSLFMSLVTALKQRDPEQSKSLARAWSSLLDAEAERAQLPAARRVWDAHRLEAYLALGEPARALPMLQQSQHEVPDDYNPPARLARVHLATQHPQLASVAINQALSRCEGPRKLRLFLLKADILSALGDVNSARSTLRIALDFARDRQLGAQYEPLRQSIESKLSALR